MGWEDCILANAEEKNHLLGQLQQIPALYSTIRNEIWLFAYTQRKLPSKFWWGTEIKNAVSSGRWNGHCGCRWPWLGRWWGTESSFTHFIIMSMLNYSLASFFFIWRILLSQHGILFVTTWILIQNLIGYEFKVRDKVQWLTFTGIGLRGRDKKNRGTKPKTIFCCEMVITYFLWGAVFFWVLMGQLVWVTVKPLRFCEGESELLIWNPTFLVPFLFFRNEFWFPEGEMNLL